VARNDGEASRHPRFFTDAFFSMQVARPAMPKKVLIVDDEPGIIVALQFLMEQNGYATVVAFSGEEAMEAVARDHPDLILLDIMLPVVDGFEVCQRVRENPEWNDIRIVLVTALGNEANVTKGLDLGADAYVTKPFANADLVARVKELLECQR
jgi:DNA-binding response OmpR family regulator